MMMYVKAKTSSSGYPHGIGEAVVMAKVLIADGNFPLSTRALSIAKKFFFGIEKILFP